MQIEKKNITIKDLVENFSDNGEDGVFGYNNLLNIRPPYQREFVYDDNKQRAVINTILKNFPLNTMYWSKSKKDDGSEYYELLDGQQRTLSICKFFKDELQLFYYDDKGEKLPKYFKNLTKEERQQFLNYKLEIYICDGKDDEKIEWFKIINIAGVQLTNQEILNAVYSSFWLTECKKYFSKTNCPAYRLAKNYLKGNTIRQDYLETALKWFANANNTTLEDIMAKNKNATEITALITYFENVIAWIKQLFPTYREKMQKGLEWGIFYNKYKNNTYDAENLEKEIKTLINDDEVTKQSGIYEYLLSGKDKHKESCLSLRSFTQNQKLKKYEQQNGICIKCEKQFEFSEMQGDHIIAWSDGGKTTDDNLQMLCKKCNATKSNK